MQISVGRINLDPKRNPKLAQAIAKGKQAGLKPKDILEAVINMLPLHFYIQARGLGYTLEQILANNMYVDQIFLTLRLNHELTELEAIDLIEATNVRYKGKEARLVYTMLRKRGHPHEFCVEAAKLSLELQGLYRPNSHFRLWEEDRRAWERTRPDRFITTMLRIERDLELEDIRRAYRVLMGLDPGNGFELSEDDMRLLMDAGDGGEDNESLAGLSQRTQLPRKLAD